MSAGILVLDPNSLCLAPWKILDFISESIKTFAEKIYLNKGGINQTLVDFRLELKMDIELEVMAMILAYNQA